MVYENRRHAGRVLAQSLDRYAGRDDLCVLGLTRGGVPVAKEVAVALRAPLDVLVVRKLGLPGHRELAFGAVAAAARVLNADIVQHWLRLGGDPRTLDEVEARERAELLRREARYRSGRQPLEIGGKTVLLVDDGLATGASMRAALAAARQRSPASIIVAAPVGASDTCRALAPGCDQLVCPQRVDELGAVGLWYRDFSQTSDDEVIALLAQSNFVQAVAPS